LCPPILQVQEACMDLPKRKANRLKEYDYSRPGAYFVTVCTEKRLKTLCDIVGDGFPVPKEAGMIAENCIQEIPVRYPMVHVDRYVIMPNHIHLLVSIDVINGTGNPSPTLGNVIGWFKYQVTKRVNEHVGSHGKRVFQRSYHDHVIRGEKDYRKIWEYIEDNPHRWKEDCFYME